MYYKFVLFLLLNFQVCVRHQSMSLDAADVSVVDFNVNDIFGNIIPVQIVTDQLDYLFSNNYTDHEQIPIHSKMWMCSNTSDLSTAINAMGYHRQMMNEYLLSDYLLKEITGSKKNPEKFDEPSIEKRFGKAKNNTYQNNFNVSTDTNTLPTNHKLIEDEGSSQYFSWLKRMSTFEDIQNQLLNKKAQHNGQKRKILTNRRQSLNINLEPTYGESDTDDELEYLDDGDITGYAFSNSPTEQTTPIELYKNHQKSIEGKSKYLYKQARSKAGYDSSYDDYTVPHQTPNLDATAPSKQTKEIGLKDITDIALTTLAFLSFGMFILQVLMCITMSKDDTSNMVMLPMEGTDNGDIPGDDNTVEIRRKRRSILPAQIRNIEAIDDLAKKALFSLNAVTSMSKDDGECHYYSLCENNKFAKHLRDTRKLWIPVWSVGITWLSTKFYNSNRTTTLRNNNPIMNSLKAIILGLSNGHCSSLYKNKCKIL